MIKDGKYVPSAQKSITNTSMASHSPIQSHISQKNECRHPIKPKIKATVKKEYTSVNNKNQIQGNSSNFVNSRIYRNDKTEENKENIGR